MAMALGTARTARNPPLAHPVQVGIIRSLRRSIIKPCRACKIYLGIAVRSGSQEDRLDDLANVMIEKYGDPLLTL
jgi:hypothetical protein